MSGRVTARAILLLGLTAFFADVVLARQTCEGKCSADNSSREAPRAPLASAIPPPQARFEVRREDSLRIPMRDGVFLSTDVYFPITPAAETATSTKLPAILIRTPYGKRGEFLQRPVPIPQMFAGQGYAVVVQDVRGKFESEGTYQLAAGDVADTDDTVRWIASQAWSNGKVGMYGCSVPGAIQVKAAAKSGNPNLVAILPQATATATWRSNVFWKGGALELGAALPWFHRWGRRMNDGESAAAPETEIEWPAVLRSLPLLDMDARAGSPPTDWRDWLVHAPNDPWWQQFDFITPQSELRVPALFVSSWHDHGIGQTLEQFRILRRNATTPEARDKLFILISPTTHCQSETMSTERTLIGERSLGDARFDFFGTYLKWYDRWLRAADNDAEHMPRVRYFVMGLGVWKDAADWPIPATTLTPYYLNSDGRANSRFGTGMLSPDPPTEDGADQYTYDPAFPVPDGARGTVVNAFDQREIEMRHDVLVYSTQPLERGVEVTGHLSAVLYVSSSAPDTDFTAKLVDVYPDGTAYMVQEGILRARYREGLNRRVWMQEGTVYKLTVDMEATSNYFSPGHKIRLEISSSSFPRFDRNLNTGGNNFDETSWQPARNRIHHSPAYPSHLLLPVIR